MEIFGAYNMIAELTKRECEMQIHILGVWLGLVSFYGIAFILLGRLPRY